MAGPALRAALLHAAPGYRGRLEAEVPLADLTWLRVGGPADVLALPADEEDLARLLAAIPAEVPVTVIGVGSNLIVREGGIAGVVIRLGGRGFGAIATEGLALEAGAAALDQRVAKAAAEAGLGGLAFYAGIPGSLGGAVRMNAGAHGGDTAGVLTEAFGVTRAGEAVRWTREALGFVYRGSALPPDAIVTRVRLQGTASTPHAEAEAVAAVQAKREATQPIRARTGGSTFKNPTGQSAWRLIDAAGLRGFRVGGAHMAMMHANFLINDANATAFDVESLGETVRARVLAATGVRLEWEIKRLGRFLPGREVPPAF